MDIQNLIQKTLGIDLTDPIVRQRAWQRLRVFRELAEECERDGSEEMANTLRRICQRAITAHDEEALLCLAILAGPPSEESS